MKKILTSLLLLVAVMASAQEVPSSFPRKFLLEHFTGDGCIYCPGGMAAMVEYIQNTTTPCIWVSHHCGYNEDEYTIPENAKIGKASGVENAPNVSINRTKITGSSIAFHLLCHYHTPSQGKWEAKLLRKYSIKAAAFLSNIVRGTKQPIFFIIVRKQKAVSP